MKTATSRRVRLTFLLLMLSAFALNARSAASVGTETIEWAAVDADLIVRGNIVSIEPDPLARRGLMVWEIIKLEVTETIKGPRSRQLAVAHLRVGRDLAAGSHDWRHTGADVLVFLDARERSGEGAGFPAGCNWLIRKHGGAYNFVGEEVVWLGADEKSDVRAMYSMHEFLGNVSGSREPLERDEILPRLRSAAAASANVRHPKSMVKAYWGSVWWDDWDDYAGVIIPLCEPFIGEVRYRAEHSSSPGSCLYVLARDHTPENEAFVRKMLRDGECVRSRTDETTPPWKDYYYPARAEAYQILRQWGVAVNRPVIDSPADWHEPAARTFIGAAMIFLAWPVGWIFVKRRDGRRFRFSGMARIWLLSIAVIIGVGWISSFWWAWSLAWPYRGEGRWQLASYRGVVRLLRVDTESFKGRAGPVGGFFHPAQADFAAWNLRTLGPSSGWEHLGAAIGSGTLHPSTADFCWLAVIPWWWFGVAGAVPVVGMTGLAIRGRHLWRRRRKQGLCAACGYDLRATPARCPECGAVNLEYVN